MIGGHLIRWDARDAEDRRHLLDLAEIYRRAADQATVDSIEPKLKSRNSASPNPE
jgi:predicted kinase